MDYSEETALAVGEEVFTPPLSFKNASNNNNLNDNDSCDDDGKFLSRPSLRRLSTVSRKFDRQNKGYLDDTELALRRLDSKNEGQLGLDKVYDIMDSFQKEHQANTELMETLRAESRANLSLKRTILGLCTFTVLLAAANIGTSFAAARLAKDTAVSATGDLTSTADGTRIGTTSKQVSFQMQPPVLESSRRRRRLEESYCHDDIALGRACVLSGEISYAHALQLYQEFCPGWTKPGDDCTSSGSSGSGGVPSLTLICNRHQTLIRGAPWLPPASPDISPLSGLLAFPSPYLGYHATAAVFLPLSSGGSQLQLTQCQQDFRLGMACPTTAPTDLCHVFSTWEPGPCEPGIVQLCGNDDDELPWQPHHLPKLVESAPTSAPLGGDPQQVSLSGGGGGRRLMLRG